MSLRLAFEWVREQMLSRASHRIAVGPDQAAREDDIWEAAVAEVDGFLEPADPEPGEALDAWLAAGAELGEV